MATLSDKEAVWLRAHHHEVHDVYHLKASQSGPPSMYLTNDTGYKQVNTMFPNPALETSVHGHIVDVKSKQMVFNLTPDFQQYVVSAGPCVITCTVEADGRIFFIDTNGYKVYVPKL